jgi:hypothetical protein
LTMSALPDAPEPLMLPAAPAFFSKTFQNFKLSSAAKNHVLVLRSIIFDR